MLCHNNKVHRSHASNLCRSVLAASNSLSMPSICIKNQGGAGRTLYLRASSVVIVVALIALCAISSSRVDFCTDWIASPFKSGHGSIDRSSRPPSKNINADDSLVSDIRKNDAIFDNPKVLNVHLVPHTHDDVGWQKTVEQYYYGQNMTIRYACVRDILDTVVLSLLESPARTFTYVEMKFFSMWWKDQTDAVKDAVRALIANDQLSFVNGGWCMHDEATTHFMGMIDQTTLGHEFLKQELGIIPKVGWQLDPFGHSATQASLLTSKAGMDALYFGRIDYQDMEIRHNTQECEGAWSSSKSDGLNDSVFWGLSGSYLGLYNFPKGFCFDVTCKDPLLVDMNRTGLLQKIEEFVQQLKVQSDRTKGNHIMLTMGGDFAYQQANSLFANLDLLMGSLQSFQLWGLIDIPAILTPRFERINIFYSSPNYYTQSKYQQTAKEHSHVLSTETTSRQILDPSDAIKWSVKTDDFFPYSDYPHSFWTGYFSSRVGFKKMERVGSAFLMAARQIDAFPEKNIKAMPDSTEFVGRHFFDDEQPLFELEDAHAVAQHHDAVSGTAMQHVANNYALRLQAGIDSAARYLEEKLKRLLIDQSTDNALANLEYCQLLNETICKISQEATLSGVGNTMHVVVYNPLGTNKSRIVRLPVSVNATFDVERIDPNGRTTTAQSIPSIPDNLDRPVSSAGAKFVLAFDTGPLVPVGVNIFKVKQSATISRKSIATQPSFTQESRVLDSRNGAPNDSSTFSVSNGLITVLFDKKSGGMTSITANGATVNVSQSWGYYLSFDAAKDKPVDNSTEAKQNSGAYIFRPSEPQQELHTIPYSAGAAIVNTSVGVEVHVSFEQPWIKQRTTIMKDLPYVEVSYSIGPIPIDDGRGKEIVTRFCSDIKNNGTFFTDSNGREFLQRRRDFRPSWPLIVKEPIAGNYYPINAAIYLEDELASMAVLTDRTNGGGSLTDGSIELMAQRRNLADDDRGVNEPMNETDGGVAPYPPYGDAQRWGNGVIIRGSYRIMVGKGKCGASLARSEMDESFAPPLLFVASHSSDANTTHRVRSSFSAVRDTLPVNVMLITFKKLYGGNSTDFLIRLGHKYAVDEDGELSQPVHLDLATLLSGFELVSAVEMTLTGNQKYNDWINNKLDWVGSNPIPQSSIGDANSTVTLQPMEIRTFVMNLKKL